MTEPASEALDSTKPTAPESANEQWSVLTQAATALACFPLLKQIALAFFRLPEAAYHRPIIAEAAFEDVRRLLFLAVIGGVLLVKARSNGWERTRMSWCIRVLIVGIAATLGWKYSCYEYNYFFDQAHVLDRLLLLALAVLVWFHPAFTLLFFVELLFIIEQFNHPLKGYSWTDKRPLMDILILFIAFQCIWRVQERRWKSVLVAVLCLFGSFYWFPAFGKLRLNWVSENDISQLFISAWVNGWLGDWPQERIFSLAGWLSRGQLPAEAATLLIEGAGLILLWKRKATLWLFPFFLILHLIIFLSSGILFWEWMALDLILMVVVWRSDETVFNRKALGLGILAALLSPIWLRPADLAWYDTPFNQFLEYEAVGASGATYAFEKEGFAPYDIPFHQGRFGFVSRRKTLVGTFGSTSRLEISKAVSATEGDKVRLDRLVEGLGAERFDEKRAEIFFRFLRVWFNGLNRREERGAFLERFAAPRHIHSAEFRPYRFGEPLKSLRVYWVEVYADLNQRKVLRRELVRDIQLDANPGADGSQ